MDEERLTTFIESLTVTNPPYLQALEQEALAAGVPIIRPQTQSLLHFLLELKKPTRILEVGTAVGFSALLMREYAGAGIQITTIEKEEERVRQARRNFEQRALAEEREEADAAENRRTEREAAAAENRRAPEEPEAFSYAFADGSRIRLIPGDAAQVLPALEGPFDLIFMDAAKGQYIRFLPEVQRLLEPGGVLLSDNILQEGEILSSKFAVTRRNRTIHKRMREYLFALTHDEAWQTIVLSTGDGAALSVRRESGT